MVQINFGQREVSCKLVYYGPGMSGKTTNLEVIHQKAPDKAKGEMVSIATETDRTLYFDFLPLDLGQVAGMHTKFQLYTVPGQVYYNATRKLVLQGVDGVIFVADSAPDKMAENIESLENLRENLAAMGLRLEELPVVLQYNKRDLPNALSVDEINQQLNTMNVPWTEACARDGKGVFPTLKEISKIVIDKLNRDHAPAHKRRRTHSSMTPASGAAPVQGAPTPPQAQPPPQAPPLQQQPAAAAPPQAPPVAAPQPAAPPPPQAAQPQAAPPPPPAAAAAPAPAPAAPEGVSPRDRHLQKAKPPALEQRRGEQRQVDLGPTDPNLKKAKEGKTGWSVLKVLTFVILTVVLCVVLIGALMVFVPDVRDAIRPILPQDMQEWFSDDAGTGAGDG